MDTCHSYTACDVDIQCSFSSSKFDASTSMDGFQDYLLSHHEQMVTSVISDEQSDMNIDLQLFLEEETTEEQLEHNQPISILCSSSSPVKENMVQQEDSGFN